MTHSSMSAPAAAISSTHKFPWHWYLKDLKVPEDGPTVFSCFSCGGGSTMGYKLAGFRVIGCCEIDPAMMQIYRVNHHPKLSFCCDIRELLDRCKDFPEMRELDVLDGSPPCSVFSMAGEREKGWGKEKKFREGQKEQRLDDLFFHFINVAKELQPKIVVAENVAGLIRGKAKGYVNEIFKAFDDAGYFVQLFLLNSSVMGVPQKRERVFFIARRKELNLEPINLEYHETPILFGTVRDDQGKEHNGTAKELLKYRKPSDYDLSDISKRIRRKDCGYTAKINSDDKVAYTITSAGQMFRMVDGLLLTDHDFISCQTFPEDYNFGNESVQYVCGMSVPPVMMANIAAKIKEKYF